MASGKCARNCNSREYQNNLGDDDDFGLNFDDYDDEDDDYDDYDGLLILISQGAKWVR